MFRLLILLSFLLISANSFACQVVNINRNHNLVASYNVDAAVTADQKADGLMHFKSIPQNYGMVFIWDKPDFRFMWMKNTYISLDMIFVNNNKIVGIVENTEPLSTKIIKINTTADKVLEINAGQVKKHNIQIGDQLVCKN